MEFRIADTFTDSLGRLTGEEQKSVKTTAFDLQINPSNPGMQFHKLDKARDPNFWSIRVSRDIRLIAHRTDTSLLLCYVGHHDEAYRWAERRKLETHPKTGAAQLVEIRETVREIFVPSYVEDQPSEPPKLRLFDQIPDDRLLGFGVPPEWLADVREANEDTLLKLADHLPGEAAEALLELATGGTPAVAEFAVAEGAVSYSIPVDAGASMPQHFQGLANATDPFAHPDAQRRFRILNDVAELEQALEFPWDKWTIFLHPTQRELVERDFSGPARVAGEEKRGRESFLDRLGLDAIDAMAKCRDAHVLQPVA
jgi:mRNA-degrading endonuclease RelE of RelBE toxin-antitoxin system